MAVVLSQSLLMEQYRAKLVTADEAVKIVKSGDWVQYGEFSMQPKELDAALARRVNELEDVKIRSFAMGTDKLYNFMNNNPVCASYPVHYTNDPFVISRNDKVFGINNAIEVDLYSQVASESSGFRQISGTGGQMDFIYGAFRSKGGKGLICLTSTVTLKDGSVVSRIRPTLSPGTIVTVPRTLNYYVVTEYGVAIMKGRTVWQRAEELINIAHPDFRDELIKEADKMNLWRKTNKDDI